MPQSRHALSFFTRRSVKALKAKGKEEATGIYSGPPLLRSASL